MKIELDHVTKILGSTAVIDDVSLSLEGGRVYGFQSINGSGKTMLMRLIAGLIHPTRGEVRIDGAPLGKKDSFPESMGLLIESPAFIDSYTGRQNLELLGYISGKARREDVDEALDRVGLDPEDKRKYRKYSLGMKQRLGIACALMEHPALVLLDEPLNSLDEEGIERVRRIVEAERARGACVVVSCHDPDELMAMAGELYRIVAGKITRRAEKQADGSFKEERL